MAQARSKEDSVIEANAYRPKAVTIVFIEKGKTFTGKVPEDCDVSILELPMAKFAELETTQLIDFGNMINKIHHKLDQWLKTAKEIMKTRVAIPELDGEAALYAGVSAQVEVKHPGPWRFSKDKMIEIYGEQAYEDCKVQGDQIEFRFKDRAQ